MTKVKGLLCHTSMYSEIMGCRLKEGKFYPIIGEDNCAYRIIDETESVHSFTKNKDIDGLSYKNWFEAVEKDVKG